MRNEYSVGCTRVHIRKQNERCIVLIPLLIEIGDFTLWDKSKKRILDPRISPLGCCKDSARRARSQIYLNFFQRAAAYLQIAQQAKGIK